MGRHANELALSPEGIAGLSPRGQEVFMGQATKNPGGSRPKRAAGPCPSWRVALLMDLFREISTHEEAALLEHLRDCERCRKERRRLRLLMRLIQTAMELPPRVPFL